MDEYIYLNGAKLLGDDFTIDQIKDWYEDEKEGYANLVSNNTYKYKYGWHAINKIHGFKYLKENNFENVLGLGSAYGDEFSPLINKINNLTILEASDFLVSNQIGSKKIKYLKPSVDGKMPFNDNSFNLITAFGVLHHIPNVTFVVNEIYRCLTENGYALIREPIVSMGDWRKPRNGLTKRERGIPLPIFEDIIINAGFTEIRHSYCVFPVIPKLLKTIGIVAYNSVFFSRVDALLCNLLKNRIKYRSENFIQKFRPTCVFYVLKK